MVMVMVVVAVDIVAVVIRSSNKNLATTFSVLTETLVNVAPCFLVKPQKGSTFVYLHNWFISSSEKYAIYAFL